MGHLEIAQLLPDNRLARRAAGGDERALAAIFDRYHQNLYRFCLAILGSPADAQDALQNTMVKVLRALPGEEREIDLKPWLYRIAHNESIELLRRRRPFEQLDPELTTGGGSLAEDAEARERLRRLIADLEQLPDRQRGALVMRELGGLDFEEIGAAIGTSPATARQTLYEARQNLRQMDEGREMDCDAVTSALSDADGRVTRRRDIRAHLRACPDCRRFREEIAGRREDLGALAPLPAIAAAGLLQGLLGGGAATSGGAGAGLAGAAAGGAAKSLGTGAAIKSAAAVAAVAAVGVGAADRSGVVDVTPWGGGQVQEESGGRAGSGGALPDSGGSEAGAADGTGGMPTAKSVAAQERADRGGNGAAKEAGVEAGSTAQAGQGGDASAGAGGSHPHGRGHEKQRSDAASQGQQTAANNKAAGKGTGRSEGGAETDRSNKQTKPPKPEQPAKPVAPPRSSQAPKPSKPEQSGGGAVATPPKAPSSPGATMPSHPNPPPQDEVKGSPHAPDGAATLAE
jgi:RNA polymerase sigma factor (sigma-70 family)